MTTSPATPTNDSAEPEISYRASGGKPSLRKARVDLVEGMRRWPLWMHLAWQDIRLRYRGSILGPFWITLSMGIMIGAMGLMYSQLFKMETKSYMPFLATGLLMWTFLASLINEGCTAFTNAEGFIKQVRLPFSLHVYRVLGRNLIVLAHNAVIYVLVALFYDITPSYTLLFLPLSLMIILLNAAWVIFLLGMFCARFRDIGPIVSSLVQVIFFLTPVIWMPGQLRGHQAWVADLNPFYHFIELVRAPLLDQPLPPMALPMIAAITVVGWAITIVVLRRWRSRLAYWV